MSNHFTYEIDERKLRVKLKDLETTPTEAAWQKFEAYYTSQNNQSGGDFLKNVRIPLNRNVILPVIFGGIIILFSFLLFNFIDIKNPVKENVQKQEPEAQTTPVQARQTQEKTTTETKKIDVPATELKQKAAPAIAVREEPKPEAGVTPTFVVKTAPETAKVAIQNNTVAQKQVVQQAINVAASVISPSLSTKTITPAPAVTKADSAKKQKRRAVPEMVDVDRSPDTRPSLNTDDRETDIRPN